MVMTTMTAACFRVDHWKSLRVLLKLKNETVLIELKNGTIVHAQSQKLIPINVDGAVIVADGGRKGATAVAVPKVAQKIVTLKPDPKIMIEISSDTLGEIKIKKPVVND
ncbi:uncharacterized protein LOC131325652 [Rhododendron vialii]|uniref:uncharacterized protein LOC131325652 n=1 Tax=Rhododendron vialii TaxID=182163 RepID=UPI00265E7ABB|nr:uncharacterized protein LOC131325652 [Rhododendron vialii]